MIDLTRLEQLLYRCDSVIAAEDVPLLMDAIRTGGDLMSKMADLDITLKQIAEVAAETGNDNPDARTAMGMILLYVSNYTPLPAEWTDGAWPIPDPKLF